MTNPEALEPAGAPQRPPTPGIPAGARGVSLAGQLDAASVRTMTPDQITAAKAAGRLDDLPAATRSLAVRVVREALTNAGRYAPGSTVRVEVAAGNVLRLAVLDDGPETPPVGGLGTGTGLTSLSEAVARRGGTMSWGPSGGGFHVTATLPGIEVLA